VTVVGRDAGRSRRGIRVHRAQTLHPSERRELEGVPILAPERTLLDIAPALGERELERAFDEALIRGLMTRASMRELLERHAGRPGVAELRGLAGTERSLTATRSEAEERMLSLVRKARLPVPQVNVRVGRFTADFFWAQAGVIVEVDGFRYHRGRAAFERDHQRDAEHQAMGLLVIRVTWRQLAREPETVVAQIAAALARRTGAQ
jgi:very-short-patch-repair endonuclease